MDILVTRSGAFPPDAPADSSPTEIEEMLTADPIWKLRLMDIPGRSSCFSPARNQAHKTPHRATPDVNPRTQRPPQQPLGNRRRRKQKETGKARVTSHKGRRRTHLPSPLPGLRRGGGDAGPPTPVPPWAPPPRPPPKSPSTLTRCLAECISDRRSRAFPCENRLSSCLRKSRPDGDGGAIDGADKEGKACEGMANARPRVKRGMPSMPPRPRWTLLKGVRGTR